MFNSDHRQVFIPIFQSLSLKIEQLFQQKCTNMAYHGKFDHNLAVKHWQQLQIRCHTFEGEPAIILEPVIMEYKR